VVAESATALAEVNALLATETRRADDTERAAVDVAAKLKLLAAHVIAVGEVAGREQAQQAERLHAAEAKLAELEKAQADDAAHLTDLIESNRMAEAITFFAGRVLGASPDNIEQVLDTLADQKVQASPEPAISVSPSPVLTELAPPLPTNVKVGRNEPCPCGSGKKYKRCC